MSKLALLDGDGFLYRVAASMEKVYHGVSWSSPSSLVTFGEFQNWRAARQVAEERDGRLWQRKEIGTLDEAISRLRAAVNETLATLGCKDMGFVVSGVRNFRDQIGTIRKYKGNRDATARPALLGELREWACGEYVGFIETDNMEADDFISVLARDEEDDPSDIVIVSNDKDLRQIPGYHYNWVTKEREYISEELAKQILYRQVLTGDVGDNIVGCWGCGPKKAMDISTSWMEQNYTDAAIWSHMVSLFEESKKLDGCPYVLNDAEDVAEEMYHLVHLLEYAQEGDDLLRDLYSCHQSNKKNEKRIRNRNGNHQGSATSECAQSATEAEQGTQASLAEAATGSGT